MRNITGRNLCKLGTDHYKSNEKQNKKDKKKSSIEERKQAYPTLTICICYKKVLSCKPKIPKHPPPPTPSTLSNGMSFD